MLAISKDAAFPGVLSVALMGYLSHRKVGPFKVRKLCSQAAFLRRSAHLRTGLLRAPLAGPRHAPRVPSAFFSTYHLSSDGGLSRNNEDPDVEF